MLLIGRRTQPTARSMLKPLTRGLLLPRRQVLFTCLPETDSTMHSCACCWRWNGTAVVTRASSRAGLRAGCLIRCPSVSTSHDRLHCKCSRTCRDRRKKRSSDNMAGPLLSYNSQPNSCLVLQCLEFLCKRPVSHGASIWLPFCKIWSCGPPCGQNEITPFSHVSL